MIEPMDDLLEGLNSEQRRAVEHDQGPLLVVAGAGTGKTQVITRRIAWLIKSGKAQPGQILALTFTEKAAAEMEQRMVELLGYLHNVDLLTFNGFGDNLIKRFGREIGLSSDAMLLSEIQRNILISDNIDSFNMDYFAPVSRPDKYITELLAYFSKLKNELVTSDEYLKLAQSMRDLIKDKADEMEAKKQLELAVAFKRYTDICREQSFLDYDDQISLAIEILERRPNVLRQLQWEIKYVLVDEFQDTNRAQNRLLELLAQGHHNLMVVGDDDQSIYRFRGAAISNILAFKENYPEAGQVVLTQNYRSSQAILDWSYRLIQHNNPERLELKNKIDKQLHAQFEGLEPEIIAKSDYESEMEWITSHIKTQLRSGTEASNMAVLVRKNSQGLILKRAFERAGLPCRLIGQSQDLYEQAEIKYLLYFFRVLANPNDSASLYHLLAGEVFNFDIRLLRLAADVAMMRHKSLEQVLRDGMYEGEPEIMAELVKKIDHWRDLLPNRSVGEVGFDFLETTGYVKMLVRGSDDGRPEYILKLNHLNQYFKTLFDYEKIAVDKSVVGYVDHLGGLMRAGETTDANDVDVLAAEVQIMTVHRSKGLEFEIVYLFDLTRGNFPARDRGGGLELPPGLIKSVEGDEDWNKREERRLMYVAMTRAKRYLAMTYSTDHGGKLPHKPSEFLSEAAGVEIVAPDRMAATGQIQQIEMFKPSAHGMDLTPNFWQDGWLVLGVRQIDDYLKCPAEFRWKHILKVPERQSANLAYGNLLHSLVEHFHRVQMGGGSLDLTELLDTLAAQWPVEGFFSVGIEARSLAQAKNVITAFYNRERQPPRPPRSVEESFAVKVPAAKVIMKGRYDAVFETIDGAIEICDYKTGGSGLSDEESVVRRAKTSDQLTMYALAWQLMHQEIPQKLTLDFLDQGLVGSVGKTAKQLEAMEQKIIKASEGIRSGDFEPGSSCFNCSHTNLYQQH